MVIQQFWYRQRVERLGLETQIPSGGSGCIEFRFAATEKAVRRSMVQIHQALQKMDIQPADIAVAELVLAEALNNVMEHACDDFEDGKIDLAICLNLKRKKLWLECQIRDPGIAMPGGHPSMGRAADPLAAIEDLPEGGFGWMLIRELSEIIRYSRVDGKNHHFLAYRLGQPSWALAHHRWRRFPKHLFGAGGLDGGSG